MSERMTAEREARCRALLTAIGPPAHEDAIAALLAELDAVRAERDEAAAATPDWLLAFDAAIARADRAEAQLAAVCAKAAEVRALETCTEDSSNGLRFQYAYERIAAIVAADRALDAALADTAAAAEAYRARIVEDATAPLRAERDTLAAALAEVREAAQHVRWGLDPDEPQPDHAPDSSGGGWRDVVARLDRALAALPADLAAERDRRVRAEALRDAAAEVRAADDIGDGGGAISAALEQVADRLDARAADERGGR